MKKLFILSLVPFLLVCFSRNMEATPITYSVGGIWAGNSITGSMVIDDEFVLSGDPGQGASIRYDITSFSFSNGEESFYGSSGWLGPYAFRINQISDVFGTPTDAFRLFGSGAFEHATWFETQLFQADGSPFTSAADLYHLAPRIIVQNPDTISGYRDNIPPELFDFSLELEVASTPVPEPATVMLLGSGLIGLAGLRRRLKK